MPQLAFAVRTAVGTWPAVADGWIAVAGSELARPQPRSTTTTTCVQAQRASVAGRRAAEAGALDHSAAAQRGAGPGRDRRLGGLASLPACCCMPPVFLGPALRCAPLFQKTRRESVRLRPLLRQTAAARAAAGADADARCRGRIGSGLA